MTVYKVIKVIKDTTQKGDEVYTIQLNNNLYVKYINLNKTWASSGKDNFNYFGSLHELIKFHEKFGIESLNGKYIEANLTSSNFGLQFENTGLLDIASELRRIIRSSEEAAFTVFEDTPSLPSSIIEMLKLMNKLPRDSDGSVLITTTARENKVRILPISKDNLVHISNRKGYKHETIDGLLIFEELDSNEYVTMDNINDIFQTEFSELDTNRNWRANAGDHTESITYSILNGSIVKTKRTSFCSDSMHTNKDRQNVTHTVLVTIGDKKLNSREDYLKEYKLKQEEAEKNKSEAEIAYKEQCEIEFKKD